MILDNCVVFDSESNGFTYEADRVHIISMVDAIDKPSKVESYYGDNIEAGLQKLTDSRVIICHNLAKHDIPLFQKIYPGWEPPLVLDTLVLSALLFPERMGGHGIEAWARRMGAEQKVQHEDWTTFTYDMLLRCESDVRLNKRVLLRLLREAYDDIDGVDMYNFDFGEYNHVI